MDSPRHHYTGVCVGGPYAGQLIAYHRPTLVANYLPGSDPSEHTYIWCSLAGHGIWRTNGDTDADIVQNLLNRYVGS